MQAGGSSNNTAIITVVETTLTVAQMPAHTHGMTSYEDVATIYYDINNNPSSGGMFNLVETLNCSFGIQFFSVLDPLSGSPPILINTKANDDCTTCQHHHTVGNNVDIR